MGAKSGGLVAIELARLQPQRVKTLTLASVSADRSAAPPLGLGNQPSPAPSGDHSYSSPQVNRVAGEESVLMLSNAGVDLLDPMTGNVRLRHEWPISDYRALQPKVVGNDVILIPTGSNNGTRAIRIKNDHGNDSAEELWTSRKMKPIYLEPYFHR